jgi:hypothetical protein
MFNVTQFLFFFNKSYVYFVVKVRTLGPSAWNCVASVLGWTCCLQSAQTWPAFSPVPTHVAGPDQVFSQDLSLLPFPACTPCKALFWTVVTSPREVTWDATNDDSVGRVPRKSVSLLLCKILIRGLLAPIEASLVLGVKLNCSVQSADSLVWVFVGLSQYLVELCQTERLAAMKSGLWWVRVHSTARCCLF